MAYIFELHDLNGFQDIEQFYQDFNLILNNELYETAVFDLSTIEFLALEALLSLICACKHWHATKGTVIEWRVSENVARYLERADIIRVLADDIHLSNLPSEYWSRGSSLSLMEAREIAPDPEQNSYDVSHILSAVSTLLLGRVSTKQIGSTSTLMSEITQNIMHSASVGYTLLQTFQMRRKYRVHIGVIDTGIGIETSLATKYPDLSKTSEYIKFSLQSGVTCKPVGDGLGLYQVENIVSRDRGALTIRSGTGMLQFFKGKVFQWDDLEYIPGTQVFITMWGQHDRGRWNYLLQRPEK